MTSRRRKTKKDMKFEKELASLLMPEILERQASYSPRENIDELPNGDNEKQMKHIWAKCQDKLTFPFLPDELVLSLNFFVYIYFTFFFIPSFFFHCMISSLVHPFLYIVGILKKRKRIEDERKEIIKKEKVQKQ